MLKFYLGDHGSSLPLIVLVVGVAFFLVVLWYLATDGRTTHRRHMESLPLDGDPGHG